METHAVIRKWNIIFLIYAELEDITTNFNGQDGYEADVKADLDQLLKIILEIDTHDSFNLLTIENKVQIKDEHGNTAEITSFDTPATNGVIHGVNGVLMYK